LTQCGLFFLLTGGVGLFVHWVVGCFFCPVANVFWNACNDYLPHFLFLLCVSGICFFSFGGCVYGVVFLSLDRLENVQAFFMACRGMLDMQVSDAFASSVLGTHKSNPTLLWFVVLCLCSLPSGWNVVFGQ
jgi:hypothetical protein